ncbi:tetratricopeptide repeat-containing glycosyltransferase family 2 protein [Shouchella tritolerans]|uniref:tetratricopeptide repeat-containing glycosyltransferase family 2 protein n=1 Tax=Shouchella tritolerans TaxID=2979466 RepID=UPI0021E98E61|nr:glycosyltransferase [Shouchella tritolerans]
MVTISLCMIVKNEEEVLHQCLSSVKDLCDEIIVVDTGSTDTTKDIAYQFTNQVFDFEWVDDFSAARNFAFSRATKDYIFWLDADDILPEQEVEKFQRLKEALFPTIDAVSMIYNIAFDEFENPTFTYRRNRLVKRSRGFKWIGAVHEYLEVGGHIISSDIAISHRKMDKKRFTVPDDRNLQIYEKRLEKGEHFSPRDLFYYANELKDNGNFQKATMYYHEFLATNEGWVEDNIRACIHMAECYKMLGETSKQIDALVRSLKYDIPHPEVSCQIGDYYLNQNQFKKAVVWYQLAIEVEIDNDYGFRNTNFNTWYPHLQLVVCYWSLGEKQLAVEHNNKAKAYRPTDPRVLYNEKFFREKVTES